MTNRIRLLGLYLVVVVWALAACSGDMVNSASAATDESAALAIQAVGKGGVFACRGGFNYFPNGQVAKTSLNLYNDNDVGTISVDRIAIYGDNGGDPKCDLLSPAKLGPHQGYLLDLNLLECIRGSPPASNGQLSIFVYWSHEKPVTPKEIMGRNGLYGYTMFFWDYPPTGEVRARVLFECREIKASVFGG